MKNFSSRTRGNSRRNFNRPFLVTLALAAALLVCIFFFRPLVGAALARVTTPLYTAVELVRHSLASTPAYFTERARLVEETEALRRELREAEYTNVERRMLEDENEDLRRLLSGMNATSTRIAAGVIARPPFVPYDSLIIDRGTREGVRRGAVVYQSGDRVLGVVIRAFNDSALVELLSTPSVETTVYVIGPDIYATAYGEGNGTVRVSVPQGIALQKGDIVVLPSLKRGVVGEIDTVRADSTEPEQSGFVTLDVPLQSLRFVAVDTRIAEPVSFEDARRFVEEQKDELFTVDIPEGLIVDDAPTTTATTTDETSEDAAVIEPSQ